MFHKIFIALSCFLSAITANAQTYYNFTKANEPYIELTGETLLSNTFTNLSFVLPLPHAIKMFDKLSGNQLIVGRNGYIITTGPTNSFAYDPLTMPLSKKDNTSSISYAISPTANQDTVITIQWKNMKLDSGYADDYINLQCKIYFNSGTIEFCYGPNKATSPRFTDSSLENLIGVFFLSQDFNTAFDYNWLYGNASNPKVSHDPQKQVIIIGLPDNGTVYRFTRKGAAGIQSAENNLFSLYPNPANTNVTLFINEGIAKQATITDALGKTMFTASLISNNQTIDVSALSAGIYYISIETEDGSSIQKFIKQ